MRVLPPEKTRFKPGQSGNPLGGKAHSKIKRRLKTLTIDQYCKLIEIVAMNDLAEVRKLAKGEKEQNLLSTLAYCWLLARKRGDYDTIEKILSRVIGKIPDVVHLNSQNLNANLNVSFDKEKVKLALKEIEEEI